MTPALLALLASCALAVALASSLLSAAGLPLLRRGAGALPAAWRPAWWLALLALPALAGAAVLTIALLPSLGIGVDHCHAHGVAEHPHLCLPHAPAGAPGAGWLALAVVLLVAGRALGSFVVLAREQGRLRRELAALGERRESGGELVLEDPRPHAFVLGLLRPTVHITTGLLSRDEEQWRCVLDHEAHHARARHPLQRAVAPLLGCLHLPPVARRLRQELALAQEHAADMAAAARAGSRARVARHILDLARPGHAGATAFGEEAIEARVHGLLSPGRDPRAGLALATLAFAAGAALTLALLEREAVHHLLETLVGHLG